MNSLSILPIDIQIDWQAQVTKAQQPTEHGYYRLIAIRRTKPKTFEEQRVIVLVVDENGFPMHGVRVAFSYSTADQYVITPDFLWNPPPPSKAFTAHTTGSGQIDQIQGSAVKSGQPGGITVYILDPLHPSDIVTGAGMLADHTGLHLTYQLQRIGVKSLQAQIDESAARIDALEARINASEVNK